MKNTNFIRDLLIKVLLIVIFVFLLMYLFPMPNLTPFYNSIFNDNIQTMKDAAEDYYTVERMPSEVGKTTKMTLQDMLDDKLIVPFVDKDGNSCDSEKSYVEVTKNKDEYELKVSLTCGKESDYVVQKIGCYNYCKTDNCSLKEAIKAEEEAKSPVSTTVDKDGNIKVVVPTGNYIYEYEFAKTISSDNWKLGDWRDTKVAENSHTKLVDKRTVYTGQKKVSSGEKLYEQVSYDYKNNYTYDDEWTDKTSCNESNCTLWKKRTLYTGQKKVEDKKTEYKHAKYVTKNNYEYDEDWTTSTTCTPKTVVGLNDEGEGSLPGTCQLWKDRTLYTGQKKITKGTTEYKHIKYGTKDNWTYDDNWTTSTTCKGNCTLWKDRTLYTGQKKVEEKTTQYKHIKYGTKEEWIETGWTTVKRSESSDVKLIDTRYTVRKTVKTNKTTCDNYVLDTNWYSSKPANTSTRTYSSTPTNTKTNTSWKVIKDSFKSYTTFSTYSGNYWYEFLYSNQEACTSGCNGKAKVTVYYYRVYEKTTTNLYQYKYCTPKTTSSTSTDEKVVKDPTAYVNSGYTIVKTEFNYKVRKVTKFIEDTKWTKSITPPKGYEYTGKSSTSTKITYVQLDKWVTNKDMLGEYTYNIKTEKQYKYAYNNPTKYIIDIKWTTSKTSPKGYEYANESATTTKITYEQLDKWVTNKDMLGEYTYNIKTVKQYKYVYNYPKRYIEDVKWTTSKTSPSGYEYTGKYSTSTKVSYKDLDKWVTNKEDLGEYVYNIKTKTQYKYRHNNKTKYIKDTIWTTESESITGYVLTGKTKTTSKTTYIDLGRWVGDKSDLGEYTYNIRTKTQYRYKYLTVDNKTDIIWSRNNPGNGYKATGNSRKIYVQTNRQQ